jgi:glycosyltransferase involved in cell wall biosynthesis
VTRVSYVVPVYNGERYLAECLESILGQTVRPHEVIVVNDGSEDRTAAIATGFGDRVHCVYQANAGHSSARNRGARLATGEFLAFLDADDLIVPRKLEVQLERFTARPELQFCDAYLRNFWSPDVPIAERWKQPRSRHTHSEVPRGSIITWLLRRSLFQRVGDFDETMVFGEDDDWYRRMEASGASRETLPNIVSRRRLHGNNLTLTRYDEYLSSVVRANRRRIAKVRDGR